MRAERTVRLVIAALVGLTWVGCAQHSAPRAVPDVPKTGAARGTTPSSAGGAAAGEESPALAEAGASAEDTRADELDDSGELDDSATSSAPTEAQSVRPHPLDGWSNAQISAAIRDDLPSLGSMSLGSANAGGLINGVQAAPNALYAPVSPSGAWGTQETLEYLTAALQRVHDQFPGTPPLQLGDISGKRGGASPPHVSHQSGRDVDIAYFYNDGARWYARGTAKNLDLPRNWAFVRSLITETDVDLILIDHSIQVLLEQYALEQGEDRAWLAGVFRGAPGQLRPIIRHAPGHATHIHIRFFNPTAQETARRCHALLIEAKLTSAPQRYLSHKVKKNETLGMISRKYGVSVARLRSVNALKSNLIREKSIVRVPVASRGPEPTSARVRIPTRRLPPPRRPDRAATSQLAPLQPPPTR